jgi:hypothetical protein
MEEKLERIAAVGFSGVLAPLPEPEEKKVWRRLLDRYALQIQVAGRLPGWD